MTARRLNDTTARKGRGSVLRGADEEQVGAVVVELRAKTQREKSAAYESTIGLLRAAASDPHLVAKAEAVDALTDAVTGRGGRPRKHPTWSLELFKRSISIFGSASAAERNLADPDLWAIVCREVAPNLPPGTPLPQCAPNRSHYQYYTRRIEPFGEQLAAVRRDLAARRTREVGLADPATASIGRADRLHTLGQDGKVLSSPIGTRTTEKVDRRTGEIRPVRQDPARGFHHEGGSGELHWGTKVAFSSLRAPTPGIRVIVDLQLVGADQDDKRGESGAFADMTLRIAQALPGITHSVIDGAARGVHIARIQTVTGIQVIAPPRRRQEQLGGVKVANHYHHAVQLPASPSRDRVFAGCRGHDLWIIAGGLHEQIITADGTKTRNRVERGQTKRQQRADGTYALYAHHRLSCTETGEQHTWWEPLTPVANDAASGLNRCEYLRALPRDDEDFARSYGFRADTESFHAQLERKFHKQRLPAYGTHRQLMVIEGAAEVQNSWALYRFRQEQQRQHAPPGNAA
jgi:hypothetical protein